MTTILQVFCFMGWESRIEKSTGAAWTFAVGEIVGGGADIAVFPYFDGPFAFDTVRD